MPFTPRHAVCLMLISLRLIFRFASFHVFALFRVAAAFFSPLPLRRFSMCEFTIAARVTRDDAATPFAATLMLRHASRTMPLRYYFHYDYFFCFRIILLLPLFTPPPLMPMPLRFR